MYLKVFSQSFLHHFLDHIIWHDIQLITTSFTEIFSNKFLKSKMKNHFPFLFYEEYVGQNIQERTLNNFTWSILKYLDSY